MFGFSFWEIVVIALVTLVVTGPKELPKMLRKVGQWSGKLRRMATELRAQSGIDDALNAEGLGADIAEIRRLARGELTDVRALATLDSPRRPPPQDAPDRQEASSPSGAREASIPRGYGLEAAALEREYPAEGIDSRGALPDSAHVYEGALPESSFATDSFWLTGESPTVAPEESAS
jgi:sec-independent protein translocase protein TatB